jgi:hypothetical protein
LMADPTRNHRALSRSTSEHAPSGSSRNARSITVNAR